ncbi:Holliday junction ATP-dependent DNA helicase RuvA [BD1-7 clade bacterium]|uniref:Holliday junction branch migration complex subunit RuvA n=1 Tax=BD1-7 clade bacterium TaxID=2029982 RepID=A0A5S9MWG8_9GAMM|nr:Holliday junction ATP-dependent DNA helicase RuvA [BD1-7 clade bacterium]
MIGWLKGELLEKHAPELLINVNGVGYEVLAPMTTFFALPDAGMVELHTHFVVREDAQQLYGFASKDERRLFRTLIKVNGVGPKLALAILSSMDAPGFVACVQHDDVQALVKIPGVGKKTAERLLVEMRDRLKDWFMEGDATLAPTASVAPAQNMAITEAESALVALGYKPQDATKMVMAVAGDDSDRAEDLIKAALKRMK